MCGTEGESAAEEKRTTSLSRRKGGKTSYEIVKESYGSRMPLPRERFSCGSTNLSRDRGERRIVQRRSFRLKGGVYSQKW